MDIEVSTCNKDPAFVSLGQPGQGCILDLCNWMSWIEAQSSSLRAFVVVHDTISPFYDVHTTKYSSQAPSIPSLDTNTYVGVLY